MLRPTQPVQKPVLQIKMVMQRRRDMAGNQDDEGGFRHFMQFTPPP